MTLAEMRTELQRIFGDLSDDAADLILNAAVQEVDSSYPWPYRESSATGVSPLAITDLGEIEFVADETNHIPLEAASIDYLQYVYGDMTLSGAPGFYYIGNPAGVPTVATYPSDDSVTIGVQYWASSTELSADADEPLAPAKWHWTYLTVAKRMAAADSEGNVAFWAQEADRALERMMLALLPDQMVANQRVTFSSEDW